jgi:uncharacterized membrane protein YtjA (UPF0391 family)
MPDWNFLLPAVFNLRFNLRMYRDPRIMLNLVVTLLIIALVAAVLGFGGIALAAVGIAKIVFFVALLLFVVAAIAGTLRAA